MNEVLKTFVESTGWREGVFAFGVRNAERTVLAKSRVKAFSNEALENALHTAANLSQNLERIHLNFGRMCLVYKNGLMHIDRRLDGVYLVFFTARDEKSYDADGLEKIFAEFRKLRLDS